jgi:ferritin
MLSETLLRLLNEQIGHEFESANLYLQMSSWCATNGFEGCASFFREHSHEEMEHMFRVFDYVNEAGGMATVPQLAKPRDQFESIREVFDATLEHERFITGKINALAGAAFEEKDFSTFNFLQWFVAEQHEEETLFTGIIDRFNLIGTDGRGLYMIDREIGQMRDKMAAAEGASGGE